MTSTSKNGKSIHAQAIAINAIKECRTRIHNKNKNGAESALGNYQVHAKIAGIFDEILEKQLSKEIAALP